MTLESTVSTSSRFQQSIAEPSERTVIADISLPLNGSINRAAPSWDVGLLDQYIVSLTNLLP